VVALRLRVPRPLLQAGQVPLVVCPYPLDRFDDITTFLHQHAELPR
jgi:hypothetical protein